jgi:hypothetical protein
MALTIGRPLARTAAPTGRFRMLFLRSKLVAIAILTALACQARPAVAQDMMAPSVTVSGEANMRVAPDLAILHAGMTSLGKTAGEASDANAKAMAALLAALKDAGVPEKDIQTARYSLQPRQESKINAPPRIVGFQASNSLTIRLGDLTRIGAVLDALVRAGANDIGGIDFVVSHRSKSLDDARAKAFADARRKAVIYARAAEVDLGRVLMITEDGTGPGPITMRSALASRSAPPVAVGEETLRIGVTVMFELVR